MVPTNLPLLPVGEQDFEKIRKRGCVYVDKTEFIFQLISSGGSFFFISRPRRFGKSLLISTLKEIFLGKKHLFEGLFIYDKIEWQSFPVVHLDFSSLDFRGKGLEKAISDKLDDIAKNYQVSLVETTLGSKFAELIQKLHNQANQAVVILVDEYDKPITDVLETHQNEQAYIHREVLRALYGIIKGNSQYIRFFLLTGITRFTKISLFSDLNNLTDLTFYSDFHNLLGYTQKELEFYFEKHIQNAAKYQKKSTDQLLAEIKEWYNGYSWNACERVYNPFSILRFLAQKEFYNFWFESGTPKFLIQKLKERLYFNLSQTSISLAVINTFDIDNLNTETLLFQTGYLTIAEKDEFGNFLLNYPNKEVEQSMLQYLITAFSENPRSDVNAKKLARAIHNHDFELFEQTLNQLFADIPAEIFLAKKEAYYHSIVFLALKLAGYFVKAEVRTSKGRLDAILSYQNRIYIFEFKLDESAEKAIEQIHQKKYYQHLDSNAKQIFLVGVNFSSQSKEVEKMIVEAWK